MQRMIIKARSVVSRRAIEIINGKMASQIGSVCIIEPSYREAMALAGAEAHAARIVLACAPRVIIACHQDQQQLCMWPK